MRLKYFCTVILLVLFSNIAFAQHANHWTFGKNIHLEFKNDTVYQYSINNANWLEGTSTYSDSSGNLKFYTFSAGNKGGGLFRYPNTSMYPHKLSLGDESSTQGWLIVQHPESKTTQLFFSTKEYSTISVILDSIVQDSVIRLPFLGGEKQNAINHKNNRDIWYANHAITGDSIYFFLVKRDQMVCCPIVSYTGLNYENSNGASTQGQIKFNPSGTMLAEAVAVHPFGIGLYHFNNEYPALDSIYVFKKGFELPYVKRWPFGLEFAPNSKSLFCTLGQNSIQEPDPIVLYQLVFDSLVNDSLGSTWLAIDSLPDYYAGGLQMAPNGKIYMAMLFEDFVGVINRPNEIGDSCEFVYNGLKLDSGGQSLYGVPTFNQSFFHKPALDFKYEEDCFNLEYTFSAYDTFNASNYYWNVLSSMDTVEYSGRTVQVSFMEPTSLQLEYTVQLIAESSTKRDTVEKTITIRPKLNNTFLGKDTFYCQGDSFHLVLNTADNLHCIHWNGEEPYSDEQADSVFGYENFHASTLAVDSAGTYTARITNKTFCQAWDTITILELSKPTKPEILILNELLISSVKADKYRWFVNDTFLIETSSDTLLPWLNGEYTVVVVSQYGCESEESPNTLVTFIGISENDLSSILVIYPNPNNGKLIMTGLPNENCFVQVFNTSGKSLYSMQIQAMKQSEVILDLECLSSGQYILKVVDAKGNQATKTFQLIR